MTPSIILQKDKSFVNSFFLFLGLVKIFI